MSNTKKIMFVALIVGNMVLTGLIVRACFAEPRDDGGNAAIAEAQNNDSTEAVANADRAATTDGSSSAATTDDPSNTATTDDPINTTANDSDTAATGGTTHDREAIASAASGQSTDMNDLLAAALQRADSAADATAESNANSDKNSTKVASSDTSTDAGKVAPSNVATAAEASAANAVPSGVGETAGDNDTEAEAWATSAGHASPAEVAHAEKNSSAHSASAKAAKYATSENGTVGDFVWFLEGKNKKTRPAGVAKITDSAALEGGWKYVIVLDPENKRNEAAVEYGHADLSFAGWMADVNLHRHRLHIPGIDKPADLSREPVTMINGKWRDGVLWAKGRGKNEVRLTDFYEQDGQQFATGSYVTFDAVEAKIALVRP